MPDKLLDRDVKGHKSYIRTLLMPIIINVNGSVNTSLKCRKIDLLQLFLCVCRSDVYSLNTY